MLSVTRSGARIMIASPPEGAHVAILRELGRETSGFEEAFDAADEAGVVLLLVDDARKPVGMGEAKRTFVMRLPPEDLAMALLSRREELPAEPRFMIRQAPRIVVFRGIGNLEAVLVRMEEELGAFPGRFREQLDAESSGCILCVTEKPLSEKVSLGDLHPLSLYLPRDYLSARAELKRGALRWLNAGLGDRDWSDLELKVYDRYEEYGLQLERLYLATEALEMGLILGESWSKDSPRFMMSIDVYRIRIMSFFDPVRVKGIMLGLEYLDDGLRIGDYDLFKDGGRKVHWSDASREGLRDRKALGMSYRRELVSLLPEPVLARIRKLEAGIRASRRD